MESKRQRQVGERIKREFGLLLQQEGGLIYGHQILVSVTQVKVSPDLGQSKIYLSIYKAENKNEIIQLIENELGLLKIKLYKRLRNKLRRMPEIYLLIDDTLDEMERVEDLLSKIRNQHKHG